ncbi:MAG: VOC family protein [Rhodobacteraceae bacterium]|nr:VOC family protein [Paracoccaceae bacterium]
MTGSDAPGVSGLNHVTLVVSDLPRALEFYCGVLGCVARLTSARGAYLGAGDLWLCLELGHPIARGDDTHLALSCAPQDFPTLAQRITDAAPQWKQNRSEGASVYFLDPDGHKLELHLGNMATRLAHCRHNPPQGAIFHD